MNYNTLDDYIEKEFPSKYLKGSDLKGAEPTVKISQVEPETLFSPQRNESNSRLVLYFEGKQKGVILGKERAKELKSLFGSLPPQEYVGKEVTLYSRRKGLNDVIHIKTDQEAPAYEEEEAINYDEVDASVA